MITHAGVTLPESAAEIAAFQSEGKRRVFRQAMRTQFFRSRLAQIDPARLDEPEVWAQIPILDKEALRAMPDEEFYSQFCIAASTVDPVLEFWRSGGSTGRPLFYPRSREDLAMALEGFARVLACAGAKPAARTHCSFPLGIHPAGQMMVRAAQRLEMSVIMAGAGTTTPSSMQLELLKRFGAQVWMGMPSYGLQLATLAEQAGMRLAECGVELIICSAEPLSSAKRGRLEHAWNAPVRDSFGMTEAGMMGAEDGVVDGFRIWSDLFLLEVIDPETRLPVAEGETGGLVVTALATNNITPFLRWYSGDLVSIRTDAGGTGPFGLFPVLKHALRTNGFFKIRGVNISHGDLEELILGNSAVSDYRCEAIAVDHQDALHIAIELKRDAEAAAVVGQLCTQVKATFEVTPRITVVGPGALAAELACSIKATRMIDRRREGEPARN